MCLQFGSGADSAQKSAESQKLDREFLAQEGVPVPGNHDEHLGRPGLRFTTVDGSAGAIVEIVYQDKEPDRGEPRNAIVHRAATTICPTWPVTRV